MSSSKILYSILLTLTLFAFSGTSIRTHFAQDLISTTCNRTRYYEICVSSLKSDPHSKTADLQGLASIALNITGLYGAEMYSYVADLKSKATSKASNETLKCLNVCIEVYGDANDNLKNTVEALRNKSSDDLKTFVTSAMTNSETCEDCFEDAVQESPVSDQNLYFSKLCSNFLAIASLLTLS